MYVYLFLTRVRVMVRWCFGGVFIQCFDGVGTDIIQRWMKECVQVPAQFQEMKGPSGSEPSNVASFDINWGIKYATASKLKLLMRNMLTYYLRLTKQNWPKWKDKVFLASKWQFCLIVYIHSKDAWQGNISMLQLLSFSQTWSSQRSWSYFI